MRMRRECQNVFSAIVFKGNRYSAISACITARAWHTCRGAFRDCLPVVAGKTFPAFPAHAQPEILHIWYAAQYSDVSILWRHHVNLSIAFMNRQRVHVWYERSVVPGQLRMLPSRTPTVCVNHTWYHGPTDQWLNPRIFSDNGHSPTNRQIYLDLPVDFNNKNEKKRNYRRISDT